MLRLAMDAICTLLASLVPNERVSIRATTIANEQNGNICE